MKLRCLIVDDESLARKLVEENVQQLPFLELAASCRNAFEAMEVLSNQQVDLIFLDIQMPGMLGTQFLHSLPSPPMVIFITAYSNYAVESYDLNVVDYLMKPVSLERFTRAAHKALDWHEKNHPKAPVAASNTAESVPVADSFFVNVEYALVRVAVREVTHVEGMKDYVKIFTAGNKKPILTKATLRSIEEKLPPEGFMRVHKSFIVSLDRVESIRNREIKIGEHEIPVGETQLDELLRRLGHVK